MGVLCIGGGGGVGSGGSDGGGRGGGGSIGSIGSIIGQVTFRCLIRSGSVWMVEGVGRWVACMCALRACGRVGCVRRVFVMEMACSEAMWSML